MSESSQFYHRVSHGQFSHRMQHSNSDPDLVKKDSNSISKRLYHLTRRIGGGIGSSNNKSSFSSRRPSNPPSYQRENINHLSNSSRRKLSSSSHGRDQKHQNSQKMQKHYKYPSSSDSAFRERSNIVPTQQEYPKYIPNNGTATTCDASVLDDATIASESGTEIVMQQRWASDEPPYTAHSFKAGNHNFTVDSRYSFIRVIGSGAYGVVISALDTKTNTKVAIKMVPKAFNDEIDAKRILREIKLLKHFQHENIIGIRDMMPPIARTVEQFNDVYIVVDLMETDLHRIIYSKQSLSIDHVQYFVYQILRALKYMHSANVLHRDLKPSNLLVNSNCDLKVCDFGLARGVFPDDDDLSQRTGGSMLLTEYVVTRWYRAPEIMLACHEYTKPIDVWSVGCIFAELLNRKPYFPGEDYIDQLTIITEKLGKLPEEDLDFVTSEKAKKFIRKLPDKPAPSLRRQFPSATPEALDLLSKMLSIHPKKRITVGEALKHPFMASLHSPEDEPVAMTPFDFGFEDENLHRVRLQELIWEEISTFRPSCLPVARRQDGSTGVRTLRA